jgi:hypothetical protein
MLLAYVLCSEGLHEDAPSKAVFGLMLSLLASALE